MTTLDKPKGPASYFPSIEKKYGLPIAHWFDLLHSCFGMKHVKMGPDSRPSMAWVMAMPMRSWRIGWPRKSDGTGMPV